VNGPFVSVWVCCTKLHPQKLSKKNVILKVLLKLRQILFVQKVVMGGNIYRVVGQGSLNESLEKIERTPEQDSITDSS
jgi:hypothetical protein